MLKIKNTKKLDTANEIFEIFMGSFDRMVAEAKKVFEDPNIDNLSKAKILDQKQTEFAIISNFFMNDLGYSVRRENGMEVPQYLFGKIFFYRDNAARALRKEEASHDNR